MKTVKAPNFEETVTTSLMEFANAQPFIAVFIGLFVIVVIAKVLAQ